MPGSGGRVDRHPQQVPHELREREADDAGLASGPRPRSVSATVCRQRRTMGRFQGSHSMPGCRHGKNCLIKKSRSRLFIA
jgi:hypothetical protein